MGLVDAYSTAFCEKHYGDILMLSGFLTREGIQIGVYIGSVGFRLQLECEIEIELGLQLSYKIEL